MKSSLTKIFLLVMTLCLTGAVSYSQRAPMRYGDINPDDLSMIRYEADTTAKALILGDYGVVEVRFNNGLGFEYLFTRHLRVKIFDKDALDLANFKLYLRGSQVFGERLITVDGSVYFLENGKMEKTKFKRSDVFMEEIADGLRAANFTIAGVQEGSVFEVEYSIRSPYLYTLPTWNFQGVYPKVFSEFRTFIPEEFYYKQLMQGYLSLHVVENESRANIFTLPRNGNAQQRTGIESIEYIENVGRYRINNIPAFTTEPHMNSVYNYVTRIEHELQYTRMPNSHTQDYSSNWQKLNQSLMESESFGRLLNRAGFISEEAEKIKAAHPDQLSRMIAAFELIQSNMTWDNINGLYSRGNMRKAWNEKQGNAADINLMLVILLKELGIDTSPVILSTRSNGMINPVQIMLDRFNYVIAQAYVGGKSYLLDATDKHNPYYLLPRRCINGEGRIVSETNSRWIPLDAIADNKTHVVSKLKVLPSGTIEAHVEKQYTNYQRVDMAETIRKYTKTEDYMDAFEVENPGINLSEFEAVNLDNWNEPLVCIYDYDKPSASPEDKDIIYINPLLGDRTTSNPFRLDERLFPVDFTTPFAEKYTVTIEIPDGYEVEELPASGNFALPQGAASYKFDYKIDDNGKIVVEIDFIIGKAMFLANEYGALKNFYALMIEEQAKSIVLKKVQS